MKTRGVDDRPNDYTKLVIGALPADSEELVVWGHHSYMEVHVLEIHAGQPLVWVHDGYDGVQSSS